jgi:2-polyprenyl-3-methyl-5-hydroxy-6-metoxy-1,4-benzoquinol methylase
MKTWDNHTGDLIDHKNGYDLIECQKCGFKHIIPIPDENELNQYYAKLFYTQRKPDYIQQQAKSIDWWNIVYSERYERFQKCINKPKGRILDIGSGPGFFLKHGLDLGWSVLGIEPGEQPAEFSKSIGVDVINSGFENIDIKAIGKFDVIHTQGVIEHLREPGKLMEMCRKILNPNGIVCFVVANEYNPLQKILTESYDYNEWWFVPPEHINYFNADSLKKFFKTSDFKVESFLATFPMEFFLMMGENYIGNDELGKEAQRKRVSFEQALLKSQDKNLKNKIYESFANIGIGRTIEIIGLPQ